MTDALEVWAPEACTLPVAERPLRVEEFDQLFAHGLVDQDRVSPTMLRWTLDARAEPVARDLTRRETACCSFFTFDFRRDGNAVLLDVQVPPAQVTVLDALAARASIGLAAT